MWSARLNKCQVSLRLLGINTIMLSRRCRSKDRDGERRSGVLASVTGTLSLAMLPELYIWSSTVDE